MKRTIVRKYEELVEFFSFFNYLLGLSYGFGIALYWGYSDIPVRREREYSLFLSDGVKVVVDEDSYKRFRIGDEYP